MKQGERKEKKDAKAENAEPENAGMHPARLAMMQAPQRQPYRQRY